MRKIKLILFGTALLFILLVAVLTLELFIAAVWNIEVDWGWEEVSWEDSLLDKHSPYILEEMPFLEGRLHNLKLVYRKRGLLGTGSRGTDLWGRVDFKGEEICCLRYKLGEKFYYSGTPLWKNYESKDIIHLLSIPCDWTEMYLIWHSGDIDVYTDSKSLSCILGQETGSENFPVSFYFRVGIYF